MAQILDGLGIPAGDPPPPSRTPADALDTGSAFMGCPVLLLIERDMDHPEKAGEIVASYNAFIQMAMDRP